MDQSVLANRLQPNSLLILTPISVRVSSEDATRHAKEKRDKHDPDDLYWSLHER